MNDRLSRAWKYFWRIVCAAIVTIALARGGGRRHRGDGSDRGAGVSSRRDGDGGYCGTRGPAHPRIEPGWGRSAFAGPLMEETP